MSEVEIKNIRKNSDMKEICRYFIDELYGPSNDLLFLKSYNCFLNSCLKSQNLETKMNALNDISEIINSIKNANKPEILKQVAKEFLLSASEIFGCAVFVFGKSILLFPNNSLCQKPN